ncbi:transposase [Desulfonema ishimotonii]|uniref:transposase n=1 Tax=Desulfonema ishimotonii TaxID=45657 RepID=UPI00140D2A01|nr:transposase [Desulfonema ishimotonii]
MKLHIIALRINGDYVFLITDNAPYQALDDYRQRWQIETLFGCLKTRGFNPEDTHLNDIERISRLFALITIAFCWSYKIGEQIHSQKAIPIKAHGRMEKSIFRKGLDRISHTLLNLDDKYTDFIKLINFLSRT